MDAPSSFIPHKHPLGGVKECLDLLGLFSHSPSFLFQLVCVVCVGGTNLWLQATKPVLFSSAYDGLENCMLCWS